MAVYRALYDVQLDFCLEMEFEVDSDEEAVRAAKSTILSRTTRAVAKKFGVGKKVFLQNVCRKIERGRFTDWVQIYSINLDISCISEDE